MKFPRGLGQGIDALLPIENVEAPEGGVAMLPISMVVANPNQPRKTFNAESLNELAETIKKHGVLEPIIVENGENGRYVIIAGERRARAAKIAGLDKIPAIIRNFTPEESFLVSIIENIQRADLNPIEEASAYKQFMEISGLNQEDTAIKIGKNRTTLANALRLLKLPLNIQEGLTEGKISAGHARALLSIDDTEKQNELYNDVVNFGLNVRETEKRTAEFANIPNRASIPNIDTTASSVQQKRNPEINSMQQKFIEKLGTKVSIDGNFDGGVIKIEYYSMDDLDRLYDILAV
jgi:ParB family chromosome partitioning protein